MTNIITIYIFQIFLTENILCKKIIVVNVHNNISNIIVLKNIAIYFRKLFFIYYATWLILKYFIS